MKECMIFVMALLVFGAAQWGLIEDEISADVYMPIVIWDMLIMSAAISLGSIIKILEIAKQKD